MAATRLSDACTADYQCSLMVPHSTCDSGSCQCVQPGYVFSQEGTSCTRTDSKRTFFRDQNIEFFQRRFDSEPQILVNKVAQPSIAFGFIKRPLLAN